MPHRTRALLFDLDDTLYPQRRFILSGFAAVARHVALRHSVDPHRAFRLLVRAYRDGGRGVELDRLVESCAIPESVSSLVSVMRSHRPLLRLDWKTLDTLKRLRRTWVLAVVTNGTPEIQRTKVRTLGVDALVDTVVYAAEHGTGLGKPERAPFLDAVRRVGIEPSRALFVGDNLETDIAGAAGCGLGTIQTTQFRTHRSARVRVTPDAVVKHIVEVPATAGLVLSGRLAHHAA